MTQHDVTGFLLRYWPDILAVIMFGLGSTFGALLVQLDRDKRAYERGWNAGYRAYGQERREIRERVVQARANRDNATRVLPPINPPWRPASADQTQILHNPRRNP